MQNLQILEPHLIRLVFILYLESGKLWWRDLHSVGLVLDLEFKMTEKAPHFGYLGFEYLVA